MVPSLAMIVTCYGDVGDRLLHDWIESAKPRLSPRHLAAIRVDPDGGLAGEWVDAVAAIGTKPNRTTARSRRFVAMRV